VLTVMILVCVGEKFCSKGAYQHQLAYDIIKHLVEVTGLYSHLRYVLTVYTMWQYIYQCHKLLSGLCYNDCMFIRVIACRVFSESLVNFTQVSVIFSMWVHKIIHGRIVLQLL